MFSTFLKSVPSKVYEAWILLIRFLVSCIILHLTCWNLISHFLAQEPNRSIYCWSFIVSSSSLISRKQTQSSAKRLISDSLSDEMSFMHRENNKGPRTVPWGDTRQNRSPVRFYSIYNNSLLSEAKKRIYPFQCLATNFMAKQFTFKEFMRWCIKCLFKIQQECVTLSSIVKILTQSFITIVNWVSQLCPFPNACCLSDRSV